MNKYIKEKRQRNKYQTFWRKTPNKSRFIHKELKTKHQCLNLVVDELMKPEFGYEKQLAIKLVKQYSSFNRIYNRYIAEEDTEGLMFLHHDFHPFYEAQSILKKL